MDGIILVDKPFGKTSHDIVAEIRRITGIKKVGHTGTLDPIATGVLPVCIGKATKVSDMIMNAEKAYTVSMILGVTTDTGDSEGEILSESRVDISENEIRQCIMSFVGEIEQIPPMYSAIKQNGKKLYELARKGMTVERKPRQITISKIDIINIDIKDYIVDFTVYCSKGTYIRVLCEDIGERLHSGAYMNKLRRIKSGKFEIDNCYTLKRLHEAKDNGEFEGLLIETQYLFDYKKIYLDMHQASRLCDGVNVSHKEIVNDEIYRVFDEENTFLAVCKCVDDRLRIVKSFF